MIKLLHLNQWSPPTGDAARILVDSALRSIVVLAFAGLALAFMKRRSAAARHLVCFLAVASLLLLPVLSWTLPGWRVLPNWMAVRAENPPVAKQPIENHSTKEPKSAPAPESPHPITATQLPPPSAPLAQVPSLPAQAPAAPTPPVPVSAPVNWWRVGLLAWMLGATLALAPALLGIVSLRYLEYASQRETGPAWLDLLGQLLTRLGCKRRVDLLKAAQRRMPMTWGVLRPKVLLPDESREWPPERRRVVLLHELAHAHRFDYLTHLITRLVCALYWFNPLVWLAARRMVAEREHACDDIVLRHGAEPADYAEQVLEISAGLSTGWLSGYGGIAMARPSNLEARLRAILDTSRQRTAPARLAVLLMLAAALLLVVPVAILRAAPNAVPPAQTAGTITPTNLGAHPVNETPGLTVEIHCTNNVFKQGDEIPIQIIFRNQGTQFYYFQRFPFVRDGRLEGYKLTARTSAGELLPDPRAEPTNFFHLSGGGGPVWQADTFLRPGDAVTNITSLNSWAILSAPGAYEVVGSYDSLIFGPYPQASLPKELLELPYGTTAARPSNDKSPPPWKQITVNSMPMTITLLARSQAEMHAYIQDLTNQIAEHLAGKSDILKWPYYYTDMQDLTSKLVATCSPEAVPMLLKLMDESSSDTFAREGLYNYLPHTEEVRKAIIEEAEKHVLDGNWSYLLQRYDIKADEIKRPSQSSNQPPNGVTDTENAVTTNQTAYSGFLPKAATPAGIPSGLSLVIRGPTNIIKQGDRIPIEFILSNHGSADYKFDDFEDFNHRWSVCELSATTTSGLSLPDPRSRYTGMVNVDVLGGNRVLRPGETFTNVLALNHWALMNEPGNFEVTGKFVGKASVDTNPVVPIKAAPIRITVLLRTKVEMSAYISGLSNQIAARLPISPGKNGVRYDPVLNDLFEDLMYTCSSEMVPTLLWTMYQSGRGGNDTLLAWEGMLNYAPHTAETRDAIFDAAAARGLNPDIRYLISSYDLTHAATEKLKPLIERALHPQNSGQWSSGAVLAAEDEYDDAFTARLIAIASGTNTPDNARGAAIRALACHRSEAGVKTLKALLNDPDPAIWSPLASEIANGCSTGGRKASHLQPGDFGEAEVQPLAQRLLTSTNSSDAFYGACLAQIFGFDALTPDLVALAVNPLSPNQDPGINALALNRTDVGVMFLKRLLEGPDLHVSRMVEAAIRRAYTSRGNALGRPLRPDDFDAKFQTPEVTPAVNLLKPEDSGATNRNSSTVTTNQTANGGFLPTAATPDRIASGLSLVIRGPTNVIKQGDEIPIEFTISNHGTNDYTYVASTYGRDWLMGAYKLIARTTAGDNVAEPNLNSLNSERGGVFPLGILHPGESFSRTIPLNYWSLMREPGPYEVVGTYVGDPRTPINTNEPIVPVESEPISITVWPRTQQEMGDYIEGLTNQLAARMSARTNWNKAGYDEVFYNLLEKLTYTCSPEIVPTLLGNWDNIDNVGKMWATRALLFYVPHTEAIRKAIVGAAEKHVLDGNWSYLLERYGINPDEIKRPSQSHNQSPTGASDTENTTGTTNQTADGGFLTKAATPVGTASGISVEIRCTNDVLKMGDEIPIEITVSNHGASDGQFSFPYLYPMYPSEVKLVAKTASGKSIAAPSLVKSLDQLRTFSLAPGKSFSTVVPLNLWALIKEPGVYQIVGTCSLPAWSFHTGVRLGPFSNEAPGPVASDPIIVTVLPRTGREMDDYIKGLTNQVAAQLAIEAGQAQSDDSALNELFMKLIYTRSPGAVSTLLRLMAEPGVGTMDRSWWGTKALTSFIPHSEEVRKVINEAAGKQPLDGNLRRLLQTYDSAVEADEMVQPERNTAPGPADATGGDDAATATNQIADGGFLTKAATLGWGDPGDGLRTRLVTEKNEFRAGEPIIIRLEVENVSAQPQAFQSPTYTMDSSLIVLDADGKAAPYIGMPAQVAVGAINLAVGQTRRFDSFDLTGAYYLRRPGRYTVQLPTNRFPGLAGTDPKMVQLPLSGKLEFTVVADPGALEETDPDGRLLLLAQARVWWPTKALRERVRPGNNREEVFGRGVKLEYNATGQPGDSGAIWLWETEQRAGERDGRDKASMPESEYIGRTGAVYMYLSVDPVVLRTWPSAKEDILRALRSEAGDEPHADDASTNQADRNAPVRVAKSPESVLAEIRGILPEDWTCQLDPQPGPMEGSYGLVTNPLFRIDFTNDTVWFTNYGGGGSGSPPPPHPCICLYFLPTNEMARFRRGTNSIWRRVVIPIGETADYGVVTSGHDINDNLAGNILDRSLAPLGWALKKYFGEFSDEETGDVLGITEESPEGLTTGHGFAGQVLDDQTGQPVKEFTVEYDYRGPAGAGPEHPSQFVFFGGRFMLQFLQGKTGWQEVQFYGGGSSMSAAIEWTAGQKVWPRVTAKGYVPQPLSPEPVVWPVKLTNLVIRLKRATAPAPPEVQRLPNPS